MRLWSVSTHRFFFYLVHILNYVHELLIFQRDEGEVEKKKIISMGEVEFQFAPTRVFFVDDMKPFEMLNARIHLKR